MDQVVSQTTFFSEHSFGSMDSMEKTNSLKHTFQSTNKNKFTDNGY